MARTTALEARTLILAPVGRDAMLLAATLGEFDIEAFPSTGAANLIQLLSEGAGTAIIAEEALAPGLVQDLRQWLEAQPPWSDLPMVVLTSSGRTTEVSRRRAQELQSIGNFTLIERPARPDTIVSSVRAALRARMRQYEVRRQQESLLQANADLEQFAYSASHDLREPVRSISIFSQLLATSYGTLLNEEGREYLSLIQSGAKRMDALLTDLRAYAFAASISEKTIEPISAAKPLEAALQSLAGAIRESDARISVGDMPVVRMNETHLLQIFQNLIGNSIKYRRQNEPPIIDVGAREAAAAWTFSVSDNGIGVPSQYKENIFGIFKRLHKSSDYPGTGMGLAICQRTVERYGGRIWVESQPGQGAVFSFTIPK